MRGGSSKDEKICHKAHDVIATNPKEYLDDLLSAHAFTECDATAQIHNFGKKSIFRKLEKSSGLQKIPKRFCSNNVTVSKIGNATIRIFELLHSPSFKLQKINKEKYDAMVVSHRSKIDFALLPPSPRAAFYHSLRVYHQAAL